MLELDVTLFKLINTGLASPWLDPVMRVATALGTGAAQTALSLALLTAGWIRESARLRRAGWAGLAACVFSCLAIAVLKSIWSRPRPLLALFDVRIVGDPLFTNGFPSGHTLTAWAVALACGAFIPRLRFLLIPISVLTGVSRVYVGAHFPLDVIFGAAFGAILGISCARLIARDAASASKAKTSATGVGVSGTVGIGVSGTRSRNDLQSASAKPARRIPAGLILALLCLALFFARLGATPLMGLDEALYAEAAREMAASGDYIVPHYNGKPFFDKPPLAYWLQAASIKAFGVDSFAVRLPSAMAASLLVALVVALGTKLHSRRTGLPAGSALATAIYTLPLARLCSLDQLFTLTITAALGCFLLVHLGLWSRWGWLGFWAATGLSLLAKGPAGAVLIFAVIAVFVAIDRARGQTPSPIPQIANPRSQVVVPFAAGLLLFVLIAAPWYVLVQRETGGAFLREFIVHQNLQRAMGEDFAHNAPFWFYLPIYLAGFFPWSSFVPAACIGLVRLRPTDRTGRTALFAAVWAAVVIVVFSISKSKLPNYIYPAYPPSALLVALLWSRAMEERDPAVIRRSTPAAVVISAVLGTAMIVGARSLPKPVPGLPTALIPMGLFLLVGSVAAWVFVRSGRLIRGFASLCCGMAGFMLIAAVIGAPIAAQGDYTAAAKLGREIKRIAGSSDTVIAYSLSQQTRALPFYAERPVLLAYTPSELRAALRPGEAAFIITQLKHFRDLPPGSEIQQRHRQHLICRLQRRQR
jgi:4-amino-4-deoxy-L-arabinose transferase-like glycosyltransferase/membrane-associated phospholipid phosphatase